MSKIRKRNIGSIKTELVKKSREAALSAVQIFNNPNISFKSEAYIVLMSISWTYLLHAYYRSKGIEYRYFKMHGQRKRFDKTSKGAYKHWELERCLNGKESPIDKDTANNLRFLIGLRHEIEHQMTTRIDDLLSARFQACCLNYNDYLKKLFGVHLGIEKHLSFSLQFSTIESEQKDLLSEQKGLPANILSYIQDFDGALPEKEYASQRYAYRILFVPKTANRKGQADRVIEFVKSDSPLAENLNKQYAVIKETEKKKYLPSQIVQLMNAQGYSSFKIHHHTNLWKKYDAQNPANGFGTMVAGKQWHYYENWVEVVRQHCIKNKADYK
ncbi:MAG: DUF3644 domain-containing protein [Oceanospirillaceae bacterium]|nr:DUF3644 domain-containing protein [Oceanospirillaceae bacterium]